MIFKLPSFLTLAFALSSLDAVTAISMPSSLDGGQLIRRVENVDVTYFDEVEGDLGACGSQNYDWDYVVSLDSTSFDNGSNCYKSVVITYNGLPVRATVVDMCPGCGDNGNIDVTRAVFEALNGNSLDAGVLHGAEWYFE